MNNTQSYLTEKLEELYRLFPTSTIQYEYDSVVETHIVEVMPFSIYDSSEYIDQEIMIKDAFYENCPDESLVFVSEDSGIRVKHPLLLLQSAHRINVSEILTVSKFAYSDSLCNFEFNLKFLFSQYELNLQHYKTRVNLMSRKVVKKGYAKPSWDLKFDSNETAISEYQSKNIKVNQSELIVINSSNETDLIAA